nr:MULTISPECIES: PD-(D/E)XK nuclease family protein [unclassified Bradyrhizobium]
MPIPIEIDGAVSVSAFQIGLYASCQRRFFYTHVLNVGGRRTPTPFLQLHDAVRAVFKEIVSRGGPAPDASQLAGLIDQAFAERKLNEHGYAQEFLALASDMIGYFLAQRAGLAATAPVPLRFSIEADEIVVAGRRAGAEGGKTVIPKNPDRPLQGRRRQGDRSRGVRHRCADERARCRRAGAAPVRS